MTRGESNSKTRCLNGSIFLKPLLLAIVLSLGAGCAKIGDPQPPHVSIPQAAVDLAAKQVSDHVVLTVSKPSRNTDGSPAVNLRRLEVFRLAGNSKSGPPTEEGFAGQAGPILSIPAGRFSDYLEGDRFVIEDKLRLPQRDLIYSSSFRYAVVFTNNKNQDAGFSNQALISPVPIPLPPPLTAEMTESFIHLKWETPSQNADGSEPARIAGYRLFRSEDPKAPFNPVSSDLITDSEFKDADFQADRTYYYRISVVGSLRDPYAESLRSEAAAVSARDVFPPQPPRDFHAIFRDGTAYLLWVPSPSADVAGYRVYRLEPAVRQKRLLEAELIAIPSFQDSGLQPGVKYEYYVTAVDAHGNESAAATATIGDATGFPPPEK